jgi:hypothetical protein
MVQIKQANIFGRIGSGIGKGLSEQIPKEIERNRLVSGLKDFEQNYQNLTPVQQLSRLAQSGANPQTIQSFTELAKQGNLAQANQRRAGMIGEGMQQSASPSFRDIQFGRPGQQQSNSAMSSQQQKGQSAILGQGQPQIVEKNPLSEEMLPAILLTPQQRAEEEVRYQNMGYTPSQSKDLVSDDEALRLAQPKSFRDRQEYLKGVSSSLGENLENDIKTRLQKSGENIFSEISGDALKNMTRAAERDLVSNKNATEKDVVEKWSRKALEIARAQGKLNTLADTTGVESIFKGDSTLKALNEYSDIYKEADNSYEYQEILKNKFNLSPLKASSIAFKPTKNVEDYISSFKPASPRYALGGELPPKSQDAAKNARKAAIEIENKITPNDSILSIVANLSKKDPYFDSASFFDQLSEDKNFIGLNDRQRQELAERVPRWKPTWGDILVFPGLK